jgi:hypothetical protein
MNANTTTATIDTKRRNRAFICVEKGLLGSVLHKIEAKDAKRAREALSGLLIVQVQEWKEGFPK